MTTATDKPLRIFCSYSRKDEPYLDELRTRLAGLIRRGLVEWWHDREIVPGLEWREAIDYNLQTADLILLLISPDLMASDFAYEEEMRRAIERHKRGEARVIPIIVRYTDLEDAPFLDLQSLPKDLRPIVAWSDPDEAWLDVVRGIRRAVQELLRERQEQATAEERYREATEAQELVRRVAAIYAEGQRHMDAGEWQQAGERFEEVQRLEPGYRDAETLLSQVRKELAPPPRVEVPDLSGHDVSQASNTLASKGLGLGTHDEASSDTIPKGQIVGQSPEAGREVQPGTLVSVKISSGPSTVEVPNLAGKSLSEARSTVHSANLALGMIARAPSDDMSEGRIVKQDPPAGSKVERNSSVRITLGSGSQKVAATESSSESGAETAPTKPLPSGGRAWDKAHFVPRGEQDRETPPPGMTSTERSATGDQVRRKLWPYFVVLAVILALPVFGVTYGYYSTTTIVPNFSGMTLSEAADEAAASDIELWILGTKKSSAPMGTIVDQNVEPNTRKNYAFVGLVISAGEGTVKVPDVSGLSQGEAAKVLVEAGLDIDDGFPNVNRSGEIVSADSYDAIITATDPPAGTQVGVGTEVQMRTQ